MPIKITNMKVDGIGDENVIKVKLSNNFQVDVQNARNGEWFAVIDICLTSMNLQVGMFGSGLLILSGIR